MKKHRFLIINTDYDPSIDSQYKRRPQLKSQSFKKQYRARMENLYGLADFYSKNLNKLGYKAIDVIYNHRHLQEQWLKENRSFKDIHRFLDSLPLISKASNQEKLDSILEMQIKQFKPNIILNIAMESVESKFFKKIKEKYPFVVMVIGQHAAHITENMKDLSGYDLIVSSLPHYIELFRRHKVKSKYLSLAFESTILPRLSKGKRKYEICHIGGYGAIHNQRNKILEKIAMKVKIDFWGYNTNNLNKNSPILRNYHGLAWGSDMYNIFYNSKITLNAHITKVAGNFANNMRLYEVTGCGSLLITDHKSNIKQLFRVGKEIVTYKSVDELIKKVNYYLSHEKERKKIARAGQERTLKEHTYYNRMKKIINIIHKLLAKSA